MQLDKLEMHEDERGTFVEAFKLPNDGQVSSLVINPGETRGNHYHLRKTEHFLVAYGTAEITVKDRETNTLMKVEVSGVNPMVVTVVPNNTHRISSEEGCVCLIWCNEQYNKDNPDTFPEEV